MTLRKVPDWMEEPFKYRRGAGSPWKIAKRIRMNMWIESSLRDTLNERAASQNLTTTQLVYLTLVDEWNKMSKGRPTPLQEIADRTWEVKSKPVRTNVIIDDFIRDEFRKRAAIGNMSLANYIRGLLIPIAKDFFEDRKRKAGLAVSSEEYKRGIKNYSKKPYLTGVIPYHHKRLAQMVKQAAEMQHETVQNYHRNLVFLDLTSKFGPDFLKAFDELLAVERKRKWDLLRKG